MSSAQSVSLSSAEAHYRDWMKEVVETLPVHLKNAQSVGEKTGEADRKRVNTAAHKSLKSLAELLNVPADMRAYLRQWAEKYGFLQKIDQFAQILSDPEQRRALCSCPLFFNSCDWLPFPLLSSPGKVEQPLPAANEPLDICKLPLLLKDVGGQDNASWRGMTTCICPNKSREGVAKLFKQIAADLKQTGKAQAVEVTDLGSGGCLMSFILVSHLTAYPHVTLNLVDRSYLAMCGSYKVFGGKISNDQPLLKPITTQDFGVYYMMKFLLEWWPKDKQIAVRVFSSATGLAQAWMGKGFNETAANILLSIDPPCLISGEIEEGFAKTYEQIKALLAEKTSSPLFYSLLEAAASMQGNPHMLHEAASCRVEGRD